MAGYNLYKKRLKTTRYYKLENREGISIIEISV